MCYLYLCMYTGKEEKLMRNVNYSDRLSGSFYFVFVIFPIQCNTTYLYVVGLASVNSNYKCLFLIGF